MEPATISPLLTQYQAVKDQHRDALLFFRIGDFYEMFNEDARTAARVLDLTLTRKAAGKGRHVPLAGVPHHALDHYLGRLLKRGFKVAICEQMEDPAVARGLVRREVIRVVTPGTVTEAAQLAARENNYLAALWAAGDDGAFGLAAADLSTGELQAAVLPDPAAVAAELARFHPAEILFPAEDEARVKAAAGATGAAAWSPRPGWQFTPAEAAVTMREHFGVRELGGLCSNHPALVGAVGALLAYLRETQKTAVIHLTRLREFAPGDGMVLDESTIRNLELTASSFDRQRDGSLLAAIDGTVTAAGGRLLQAWLLRPLLAPAAINARLDRVAALHRDELRRQEARELLKETSDLQRLTGRLALRRASPRDLLGMLTTLTQVPLLARTLQGEAGLAELAARLDPCRELAGRLDQSLEPNAPASLRDGGVIRAGCSPELDELRLAARGGKEWIAALQEQERRRTGIGSLKVGYTRVFGYYLEVTHAHTGKVPDNYERKQTLTNAERYVTPELKEKESFILGAEEKLLRLEERLFGELLDFAAGFITRLQELAGALAELDVFAGLAQTAADRRYVRPTVDDTDRLEITGGRHPVIEQLVGEEPFVPNDTVLGGAADRLAVITGPNMAGKSTYIRQTALIVLLAQTGSFVPAAAAAIGAVDRIFTRVGAADQLHRGRSTFMVEMIETALILNRATKKSLLILDEIGRGTSTYDGLAIAWAVAEYIAGAGGLGAKTLFATHYHELTGLARVLPGVKNYNVAVREWNDGIVFLRRIVPGGADRSYGIQVARLAGLPRGVIERAREILLTLEQGELGASDRPKLAGKKGEPEIGQPSLFEPAASAVVRQLAELDVEKLTPLAALNLLSDLRKQARAETE